MASTALTPAEAADPRRFLPPPGVHPNGAVFGAAALPKPLTWQRREHAVQRRHVLGRIGQLLAPNARLVDAAAAATWALARKLEVLLFLHSASLLEYCNVDSLARRVQALTASVVNKKIRRPPSPPPAAATHHHHEHHEHHEPMAVMQQQQQPPGHDHSHAISTTLQHDQEQQQPPTTSFTDLMRSAMAAPASRKRRSCEPLLLSPPPPSAKRSQPPPPPRAAALRHHRPAPLGQLLFRGDDLARLVWRFVDGVETMRSGAVCRAARRHAPHLVTSLQLSCNAMLRALTTADRAGGQCVLRQLSQLARLDVVALSAGTSFGTLSMRATDCPQRFVVTHDDHERLVRLLALQLRARAFPQLTRLALTCLFTNEQADGEADVLLHTLMTGCCPLLRELCLPGNSFGDAGAIKVAQMLRARVCPQLSRLDLRRNFIAEEGLRSVCHALADGCAPRLEALCLGGNTLTDSCFHHALFAMESRHLSQLTFLGVEMNYLSGASMALLGRTIGKLVCPRLRQISYSDNSVPDADAKRMIATAVYQERTLRLRQQHLRHQQKQAAKTGTTSARTAMALPAVAGHQPGVATMARPPLTSFPYHASSPPPPARRRSYSSGDDDDEDDAYSSDSE